MSMEDILKVLVDSRQQGSPSQQGADPMAGLIGSLLGGTQSQGQAHAPVNPNASSGADAMASLVGSLLGGQPQTNTSQNATSGGADLSGMMGLLESVIGGQAGSAGTIGNDPIMALLTPFVPAIAKKVNVSPEIAMIVISFVVHKLLAHHPTSGRDSNSFNLDDMLGQMSSGKVDPNLLRQSGMVKELSQKTGLDEATTEQALQVAFTTVGKTVSGMASKGTSAKPSAAGSTAKPAGGKSLGNSGAKQGKKIGR